MVTAGPSNFFAYLQWTRLKKSNEIQLYADIYLLLNYSTCFWRPSRPSSGVHKTVVAASGTDRTIWEASFFKRNQIRTLHIFVVFFSVVIPCMLSSHSIILPTPALI